MASATSFSNRSMFRWKKGMGVVKHEGVPTHIYQAPRTTHTYTHSASAQPLMHYILTSFHFSEWRNWAGVSVVIERNNSAFN